MNNHITVPSLVKNSPNNAEELSKEEQSRLVATPQVVVPPKEGEGNAHDSVDSVETIKQNILQMQLGFSENTSTIDGDVTDLFFDTKDIIALFQKRNYKIRISWGTKSNSLSPKTVVLDTGAGPNLVNRNDLPREWMKKIRLIRNVKLTSASRNAMNLVGVLPLFIRMGDLKVRVWFGVVENLAVPVLLGTSYIDRFVQGIFPQERKVVPNDSRPVAILSSFAVDPTTNMVIDEDEVLTVDENTIPNKVSRDVLIRVAKQTTLPPMSETIVTVTTKGAGLMLLSSHPNLLKTRTAVLAQGVMDILPDIPFKILLSNWSNKPTRVPKHMIVAMGTEVPSEIVEIPQNALRQNTKGLNETINAIPHYKEKETQETKFARHRDVNKSDSQKLAKDWKEELNFNNKKHSKYKEQFLAMLSDFADMWDGHLATITAV